MLVKNYSHSLDWNIGTHTTTIMFNKTNSECFTLMQSIENLVACPNLTAPTIEPQDEFVFWTGCTEGMAQFHVIFWITNITKQIVFVKSMVTILCDE